MLSQSVFLSLFLLTHLMIFFPLRHRILSGILAAWTLLTSCQNSSSTTDRTTSSKAVAAASQGTQGERATRQAPQAATAIARVQNEPSGDVPALHKSFEEIRTIAPGLLVIIKSVPVADSSIIREPSDLKLTFTIKRDNKIIYRDTADDGLAYSAYSMPQTKQLYPLWVPTGKGSGELLVAFSNRPAKELARRFHIANSEVVQIDTLPTFNGAARDLDNDGKPEFSGFYDFNEIWDDGLGRHRKMYVPTLYYEVRSTGLVLDSALTKRKAQAQYGRFWGFKDSSIPVILAK